MNPVPYSDERDGRFYVGARDLENRYEGPQAEVSADSDWLHIETDPYEGVVMLNVEIIPLLIKTLQTIQRRRKRAAA